MRDLSPEESDGIAGGMHDIRFTVPGYEIILQGDTYWAAFCVDDADGYGRIVSNGGQIHPFSRRRP